MILNLHLAAGTIVVIAAILLVWRRPQRRIVLYFVTVQIILGLIAMFSGYRPIAAHLALAILGWAGYMAANGLERDPAKLPIARIIAGASSLCLLFAFYLGRKAIP
jgi:hypothetical protein